MATAPQSEGKKTKSSSAAKRSSSAKSASGGAKSTSKTTSAGGKGDPATRLLMADHRAVEKLFSQFEKAKDEERKHQLAMRICMELTVHAQIEEEIFYPISRDFLDEDEMVNEAVVEHASAKDLIAQIEKMDASDQYFDAKVTVLKEMIEHHVEEEEKEFFPKVRKTDMDLKGAGERMKARKEELMGQMDGHPGSMH